MFKKNDNHGFTMVELIIIIVIVAIIAAIAIPVTLSIIDSGKEAQHKMDAKNIWNGAQSEFLKLMVNEEHYDTRCAINQSTPHLDPNKPNKVFSGGDFERNFLNINETAIAGRILKNVADPCMVYIGAGRYSYYYDKEDYDKAYKIYVVIYQYDDETSPILFYNGSKISQEWPFDSPALEDIKNRDFNGDEFSININGTQVPLQFYCLRRGYKNDRTSKTAYKIWKEIIVPIAWKQNQ